ncbi:lysozyme family protein [Bradyrhizobium sp. USDA 4503]
MVDLTALKRANDSRWSHARITRASSTFTQVATRLVAPAAKARYLAVASRTGVPWFVIAVIHERECSQSWAGSLAQGDPWNKRSVHVPAGRGPFKSWEDCAVDALVNCAPYAARNKDWSIGGILTLLEQYNGLGYASRGRPSPYIWAGTDQYVSGKYVRDGVYDPNAVDQQLGCAGMLQAMMRLDASIKFGAAAAVGSALVAQKTGQAVVAAPSDSAPSITRPAPGSIGAWIASFFKKAA